MERVSRMRRFHKCGVLSVIAVLSAMTLNAWQQHNAPDFKWTPLKMRVAEKQEKWNYIRASGLSDGDVTEIEKTDDGKTKIVETFVTQYSSVGIADLNDDGVNDAMIIVPWMGNGLNADGHTIAFLVSDGKGGRMLTVTEGHGQDLGDIAVINGKKYFMSSDFRYGKGHNYWIYRPYAFRKDGNMREASAEVGKPFPALTIFYNDSKFKAEVITPPLKKMIDDGTNVKSSKWVAPVVLNSRKLADGTKGTAK